MILLWIEKISFFMLYSITKLMFFIDVFEP